MKAPRVITLSYHFPPLVGIASERAAARADSLRRLGWDVAVVTARDGHYHAVKQQQEHAFPVIRTPSLEISRVLRRIHGVVASDRSVVDAERSGIMREIPTGRIGARLRRWIREWIYVPDAQVGWIPFATAAALRAAGNRRSAVVISTSVPYSAHFAAYLTATLSRSAWVAEFRDPWGTAHEGRLPLSRLRRRLDRVLERFILDRCDHIVVTSETTKRDLVAGYAGLDPDRVTVVMNGFVPMPDRRRPTPQEPCRFVYAGTVAVGERPDIVMAAFDRLQQRTDRFEFLVLGPVDPWLNDSDMSPAWLELGGVVTPTAAREAILESSAVVLLQAGAAHAQVLSGKAFEYIGARRPIVAVVAAESEMAELLRNHADVRIVPGYDVDRLEAALERLIEEHQAGRLGEPTVRVDLTEPLTRDAQSLILDRVLHSLLSGNRD
jgi:glycosyltransferase involved in cell wall biosynthesis